MPIRIFVPTQTNDIHAVAAAIVLRELGAEVMLYHGSDFPTAQLESWKISNESGPSWTREKHHERWHDTDIDVVWNRRIHPPRLLADVLHPDDEMFAALELEVYARSLWVGFAAQAIWVNPRDKQISASSKMLQLATARGLGFSVPKTLISNSHAALLEFYHNCDGDIIYKPFYSLGQPVPEGLRIYETSIVSLDDVPEPSVHRHTIGIYQQRLAKKYEARVNVFGMAAYSIKIDSQAHGPAQTDWRNHALDSVPMMPLEVPERVITFCREMLQRLGLLFGAFDFIITEDEQWFFLEVNQAGQFLFLEQAVPEVTVLSGFCNFLMDPSPSYSPPAGLKQHRLAEVLSSDDYAKLFEEQRKAVPPSLAVSPS